VPDRQFTNKRNIETRHCNHCCDGNTISVIYPVVPVVLVIHHAKRLNRFQLPVTSLALPHFSTLSHERHDFQEKVIENKTCVLIFSTKFF